MPQPRRSVAGVRVVFLGGALSAILSGHVAVAAALPASALVSIPYLLALKAATPRLATASADDKQRVPKPTPPPPPKIKPDDQHGKQEHQDEGDSDCLSNCFGVMDFSTSLFEGPTPPPALVPATAFESEASQWAVGSDGWLFAPTEVDSVGLWDAPAEPAHPGIELGRLPHGAHVVVVETHAMATGFWVHVRPFDGVEPNGWVPSSLLAYEPAPKPAPPRAVRPDPRWGMRLLVGGGGLGPADLDLEYSPDHAVRVDLQYIRLLKQQWVSGFGFNFRNFEGHPKQAYLTSTTLDDPHDSKLRTYELGTRAGQRYGDRSGFRFDWMLGPTLAYVSERAKLNVYSMPGLVPAGKRDDSLGRWAGGGELRTNFGWCSHSGNEWGLHLGAFMFAWEGQREHSLTTDFVRSNIHGWDISVGYSFFR